MPALISTRRDTFDVNGPFVRPLVSDNNPAVPYVVPLTDVKPDAHGMFKFNREEGFGSVHLKHWQVTLGGYIAKQFLHLKGGLQWQAVLPPGYVLYSHCCSLPNAPMEVRFDLYLTCGQRAGGDRALKFRSPHEFMPHYCWLLENGPRRPGFKCCCKYCRLDSRSQTDINKDLGLPKPVKAKKSSTAPQNRLVVRTNGNGVYTVSSRA